MNYAHQFYGRVPACTRPMYTYINMYISTREEHSIWCLQSQIGEARVVFICTATCDYICATSQQHTLS